MTMPNKAMGNRAERRRLGAQFMKLPLPRLQQLAALNEKLNEMAREAYLQARAGIEPSLPGDDAAEAAEGETADE